MKYHLTIKTLRILAILLLSSFFACSSNAQREDNQTENRPAIDAPDFTLDSVTGENITLSELKGKVVLLDFWATWCGPCLHTIPELVRLDNQYRDKGLVILGVSMDTMVQANDAQLKKFIATFNIKYHVMRDDGVVSYSYYGNSPAAIPTMHIINKQGKIVNTIIGVSPGEAEETIKKLL